MSIFDKIGLGIRKNENEFEETDEFLPQQDSEDTLPEYDPPEDKDVVREKTPICNVTDLNQDIKAPTEIHSTDLIFFKAGSADGHFSPHHGVDVYAARTPNGIFACIGGPKVECALFSEDCTILQELQKLIEQYHIIEGNGFHSHTHGLSEDFGGSVDARYSSGEYISKSDNRTPVLSAEAASDIQTVFRNTFAHAKKGVIPPSSAIAAIKYHEKSHNGHYCTMIFRITDDGAFVSSEQKYSTSDKVYKKEKAVALSDFDRIRRDADTFCMLGQQGLDTYHPFCFEISDRSLTYILSDGSTFHIPQLYGLNTELSQVISKTKLYLDSLL
ncbi:MAG: hypothetical protein J5898_03515 [Lachnospiraceae bacterium]|nr:hypothetical protein [Lachnospiraceae bacterium]